MNEACRQALCTIVRDYGLQIGRDPRRCEALLRDLCPGNNAETNVLSAAVKEGIPDRLLSQSQVLPMAAVVEQIGVQFAGQTAIDHNAAKWAVESWAVALGMTTPGSAPSNGPASESPRPQVVPPAPTVLTSMEPANAASINSEARIGPLYSYTTLVVCTFLFTPMFALWLLSDNYAKLGNSAARYKALALGFLSTSLILVVSGCIAYGAPELATPLGYGLFFLQALMTYMVMRHFRPTYDAAIGRQAVVSDNVTAWMLLRVAICFGFFAFASEPLAHFGYRIMSGPTMEFGSGEVIECRSGVTNTQAKAVGEVLKSFGYFDGKSPKTVTLEQNGTNHRVSFVVNKTWDDPEVVAVFSCLGTLIATTTWKGESTEIALTDEYRKLRRLIGIRLVKSIAIGNKGHKLFYSNDITDAQAEAVRKAIGQLETSIGLDLNNNIVTLSFMIATEYRDDPKVKAYLKKLAQDIKASNFRGKPVQMQICNEAFIPLSTANI